MQFNNLFIIDEENEGYFGQEQVPLTDEIRDILYNYSDGQLFKVRILFTAYYVYNIQGGKIHGFCC